MSHTLLSFKTSRCQFDLTLLIGRAHLISSHGQFKKLQHDNDLLRYQGALFLETLIEKFDSCFKKVIHIPCEQYETDFLINAFFLFCSVHNGFQTYNIISNKHIIKDIATTVSNKPLVQQIIKTNKRKKQGKNQEESADNKQSSIKKQGN